MKADSLFSPSRRKVIASATVALLPFASERAAAQNNLGRDIWPESVHYTDRDFRRLVIDPSHNRPVVVEFWARWCTVCPRMHAFLTELFRPRPINIISEATLVEVDTSQNRELTDRYSISSLPSVLGFRQGEIRMRASGYRPAVGAVFDFVRPETRG